ncbi:Natural resistance-associated macrophage protein [Botrimarina colliarenosi]|uniref:Natural resistance-associated macrophage protein n=1 Tax=Botrimarina colliarenosi TaxID=2528001 RepID=A0A5C6AKN7_9BACT|nr:Nramp family divalent metal transporter [Botrimarina colliarenosi]TWT99828.1 Natural resistance-associated macrophage protein [Botrimarina colliarenosi]
MAPKSPSPSIATPPRGAALLLALGPAVVWCAEYIGSGEVILATRTGAILGTGVLWAVVVGVYLKYLIGMAGGWYTVATGESMIDLFGRLPGPRNAFVWLVLVVQVVASVLAISSIAATAGVFVAELTPLPARYAGWAVTLFAVGIAWVGEFRALKLVMATLISMTLVGVVVIATRAAPPLGDLFAGLTPHVPVVPGWAIGQGVATNAWAEMLPLLGWGAGGFASQVWYTYWVMGAGYGAAAGGRQGQPADVDALRNLSDDAAERLVGWRRVVTFDATAAMLVGVAVTAGFLIAGAGVLGANQLAPDGAQVALTLATIFGDQWGAAGATLFLVGGAAALVSTQLAQVAGWPYLMDDCVRLCLPRAVAGWTPLARRRGWLVFYVLFSMTIVYTLGYQPVALVKFAAIAEGLLLTPLQALAMLVGLYWVLPRMFRPEVARQLRPSPAIGVGLAVAFLVFSYFCVVQLPRVLLGS